MIDSVIYYHSYNVIMINFLSPSEQSRKTAKKVGTNSMNNYTCILQLIFC